MNDELTILKLFFLLEKTYRFDDMFYSASTGSHRNLKKNRNISVFGEDENRYHIIEDESVLIITSKRISGKVVNVAYSKQKHFSKLSQVYDEIYAAALEHNFFHEIGKFS